MPTNPIAHISTPKLTLIGAGPGDPELLTIKAARALEKAKVILYDALVNPDVLKYANSHAIKRFVGKRAGLHTYSQEDINKMIVEYAHTHGAVVRLKGGDPFVFGRGYEEIIYAESFKIKTEVIPGLTSATCLPSLNKIPLTSRGMNESFWVLTGATSDRKISNDIFLAAQTKATAVILMGLKKLPEIVAVYEEAGKAHLPLAIIINGSLKNEQIIPGHINDIEEKIEDEIIKGPALLIIGEAVDFYLEKMQLKKTRMTQELQF